MACVLVLVVAVAVVQLQAAALAGGEQEGGGGTPVSSNHVMCLDKYVDIPDNGVALSRGKRGILQMVLFLNSFRGVQIPFIG